MEPIAIVGISFRLPQGAENEDSLWSILEAGKNVMTEWPESRANLDAFCNPKPSINNAVRTSAYSLRGSILSLSSDTSESCLPEEAIFSRGTRLPSMLHSSPSHRRRQHRWTRSNAGCWRQRIELWRTWTAGIPAEKAAGTNTAVFAASMADDYAKLAYKDPDEVPTHVKTGLNSFMLANRLSWFFDLKGPSIQINTACSSSLVATDLACQSLRSGQSPMAIVAGSNLALTPEEHLELEKLNLLSPDSRCYSFDSRANGYARGEGVVVLVLKTLTTAIRDRDMIRAVIRASGSNQDGHTPGLTQPSGESQEDLIRSVYRSCSLDFGLTRYIEAHGTISARTESFVQLGTGTQLGDSVEAKTIGRVFRTHRSPREPLYIGSVKANIGHLEGASGIVGILKSVMILERGIIPPNALFEKWNGKINVKFNNLCTKIMHSLANCWFASDLGEQLRLGRFQQFALCRPHSKFVGVAKGHNTLKGICGIDDEVESHKDENGPPSIEFELSPSNSKQGLSSSQAHEPFDATPKAWLLVWSAKDETALKRVLGEYDAFYAVAGQRPGFDSVVGSLAYTLSARRSLMPWRSFAIVDSRMHHDTAKILSSICARSSRKPGLAFVFTGQGAQYAHMGLDLLVYPTFHATLTQASVLLQELGAYWSLMEELKHTERINSPQMSQPLCTVLQIALVELLRSFGIVPNAVVGHSSGEIAAAYAIGALSFRSACKVAFHRGRLAQGLAVGAHRPGGMMSINMAEADVDAYLAKVALSPDITVACINSPSNVTLSGPETAIDELHKYLEADQIFARIIETGVAYHSPAMLPISEDYASCLGTLEPGASDYDGIIMASSVTGHRITAAGLLNRQYWVDNLISPVRFADALRYLTLAAPNVDGLQALSSFVEIGPHAALKRPINDTLAQASKGKTPTYHAVLSKFESPVKTVLGLVGQLFVLGHSASVTAANQQQATAQGIPFLVDAPSYPFNHSKLYWHESRLSRDWRLREALPQTLLGVPVIDWNPLEPRWRKILRTTEIPWLEDHAIGENILFPAAGSIMIGIEAVKTMLRTRYPVRGFRIKMATFLKPIVIRPEADNEVMTHVRPLREPYEKSDLRFEVQIFAVADSSWSMCFKSTIHVEEQEPENGVDDSQDSQVASQVLVAEYARAKAVSVNQISKQYFYQRHRELGQKYGDAFSLADDIHWDGDRLVVANVNVGPPIEPYDGIAHPTILDTAFQLCYVAPCNGMSGNLPTTVPHRIRDAWISATGWQHPSTSGLRMLTKSCLKGSGIGIDSSIQVLSDDGSRLCSIAKLELMPIVGNHESDNETKQVLHRIDWKPHLPLLSADQLRHLCYACNLIPSEDSAKKDFYDLQAALRSSLHQNMTQMLQTDWTKAPQQMEEYISLMRGELQKTQDTDCEYMNEMDAFTQIEALGVKRPAWKIFVEVVQNLLSFIRGDHNAIELLTSSDLARSFYEDLLGRFRNQALMTYFHLAVHQAPPLRVLEIGAGSGAVTQLTLSIFDQVERETGVVAFSEYIFTDHSDSFFDTARQRFGDYNDRMTFRTLDIERDIVDQGFSPASFDIVLVGGALYATRRLPSIVQDVRQLLKPGGHLVICDTAIPEGFVMSFLLGLLPEFWIKTVEGRTGPGMTQGQWDTALREGGFSGNDLVVRDEDENSAHHATIIISTNPPLPLEGQEATKAWLIVREEDHYQNEVAQSLAQHLTETLQREPVTIPLTGLSDLQVANTDYIVFLAELGNPLLADVSASTLDKINWMVQQSNNLLWVASGDAGDGGSANACPQTDIKDGFLRTLRAEFTNKRIVSLTLDETPRDITSCTRQISAIIASSFKTSSSPEREYVIQDGHIHTGRLVEDSRLSHELSSSISPQTKSTSWLPGPPLKLAIQARGQLETLHFIEDDGFYQDLGPTDVEIEAKSWAVNFRDVFGALGRLEEPYFGTDCAGVVTRIGDECTSLSPGDRVCMCVVDCMRMYPRATEANVIRIPASMSFEEACAIINPAVTAWYSLVDVARLRRGEKILIHSAAGATGQLAIQVSQLVGAEVFATVGSDVKKQLLIDLYGIPGDHILYSRSGNNTFASAIMRLTDGYGVDVVLNSLVGEGLRSSWECIAPYGRFVEIGKVDINANSSLPMASFANNATFTAVDVLHILLRRQDMASELLHKTMAMAFDGRLHHPRPLNVYDVGSVEDAFRYIQRGKHSGRVVISIDPLTKVQKSLITRRTWRFDGESSYLVVGGLGGVGRSILAWMVARGAKNLIVPSRSGAASHAAAKAVRELRAKNITILTPKCDVASSESFIESLDNWKKLMPPIRGCINLAMVLNDAFFENMTHSQWIRTMDSKVATSWNLHTLLGGLDFMILFSSVSGIAGNPGQSNYAAGCTFQDSLAHWRTSHGRRTTAIDLGVVSEVGVVAETDQLKRHLAGGAQGFGPVDEREILALLDICCDPAAGHCPPQIILGLRTPADFLARSTEPPETLQRPLFAHFQHAPSSALLAGAAAAGSSPGTLFRQAGTAEARTSVVVETLARRLARALAVEPGDVDADRPLHAFGVDSLVGVELRNWIAREFAANLPVFEIVGGSTVTRVAQLIEGCSQVKRRSE
ncbi:hypothetical protein PG991_001059 [Apiospora marii]|uniref:Carrier domain-containing protein n=1 Tax=Apiospora marii TaxID=335849 RepID=A0ABR1SW15_9PEZI